LASKYKNNQPKPTIKTMNLKFPLEEYFKYHPPSTVKRVTLHDRVNNESLQLFKDFTEQCEPINEAKPFVEIEETYDRGMKMLNEICTEPTCYRWAQKCLIEAKQAALSNFGFQQEHLFMNMQQFRMFLNQAVTIQELENEV
jgi:hypothetical protein